MSEYYLTFKEDTVIDVKTSEEPDIKKIKTEDKPTVESAETTIKHEHNDNSDAATLDWKDAKSETVMAAFKKETRARQKASMVCNVLYDYIELNSFVFSINKF